MNCPKCDGKTKVIDSRVVEDGVYRRRKCSKCGYEFPTEEFESEDYNGLYAYWKTSKHKKGVTK